MYLDRKWRLATSSLLILGMVFCVIGQVLGVPPTPKRKAVPLAAPIKTPKRPVVVTTPSKYQVAVTKPKKRKIIVKNSAPSPAPKTSQSAPAITPPTNIALSLPEMVRIPGGTFQMGSNTGASDEQPVHSVTLDSFSMSKHEVTVRQYESYCKDTGKQMPEAPTFNTNWSKKDHPVVNVSWHDAMGYCRWLSKKTGKSYDLPREAEWEYAARGGLEVKKYPWGDEWDASKCTNSVSPNRSNGTSSVGSYPANGYGLCDMSGNVWEWCKDWYGEDYYKSSPSSNPLGPTTGEYRVLRGGSWDYYDPDGFRCAVRGRSRPASRVSSLGFRPVFH